MSGLREPAGGLPPEVYWRRRHAREVLWRRPPHEFWQQQGKVRFQRDIPGHPPRCVHERLETGGNVLERAVLQQSGEEEVTRFEEREVLGVVHLALWQ